MPRNEKKTRIRGWNRRNTRIGPVMDRKVCRHEDRYSIEVLVQSLFQDRTASWVRIVNGVDKYVTESVLTKEEEDEASEKPIAKARPRQKPTETLTSASILVRERKWIDIGTQRSHDQKGLKCQKPLPDCYDMIEESLEELTDQFITVTSSKSAKAEVRHAVDPGLRDNVLSPKGFTEHIYHIGGTSAPNSIIRNGFDSRRKKPQQEEDKLCSALQ